MKTTIKLFRNEDGTINIDTTCDEVYRQVLELSVAEETSAKEVGVAVHAVFDMHLGKTIPMPAACSLALVKMECPYERFVEQEEVVRVFIRNSSEFKVNKGKGGGVVRLCDQPTE